MARRRRFHPQRLYPRFAPLVAAAARVPSGLQAAVTLLGPVAFDKQIAYSEDAKSADIGRARVAIVGFPRTGTTFMQASINTAFNDPAACWKNHDVLAIPEFTRAGIPVFVPLRDPKDVIISWMLYNRDNATPTVAKQRIATYMAWHREALRHADEDLVSLVDLGDFERDPLHFLGPYLDSPPSSHDPRSLDGTSVASELDQSAAENAVALEQKHVPSERRNALKPPYIRVLASPEVSRHLDSAARLMDRMRSAARRL